MALCTIKTCRMRRNRSVIIVTQCARTRSGIVIPGCTLPSPAGPLVTLGTVSELRVGKSRSVIRVAITAVRWLEGVDKFTTGQMTWKATGRRANLATVSLRLVGLAVASYVAITQFIHECERRICVISVYVTEVVSLSGRMFEIDQPGLIYVGGSVDIVTDKTWRVCPIHVRIVVSAKSIVVGKNSGQFVALPAQSVVTAVRPRTIVIAHNVRVFEKRTVPGAVYLVAMGATAGPHMLVVARTEEAGFVVTGTAFGRKDHIGGRISIVTSQAPLILAAGPKPAVVEVLEPDYSIPVSAHFVASSAIRVVNRPTYMAGELSEIATDSDNLPAKALLFAVATSTQTIARHETILMAMTISAVAANLMLVV